MVTQFSTDTDHLVHFDRSTPLASWKVLTAVLTRVCGLSSGWSPSHGFQLPPMVISSCLPFRPTTNCRRFQGWWYWLESCACNTFELTPLIKTTCSQSQVMLHNRQLMATHGYGYGYIHPAAQQRTPADLNCNWIAHFAAENVVGRLKISVIVLVCSMVAKASGQFTAT